MTRGLIVNGVLFQLVWIACVWGGATGRWWLGVAAVLSFALWQVPRSRNPRSELTLVAAAVTTGLIVDTGYVHAGLIAYPHPGPWEGIAPIWILSLWVGFALTLNHSLAWLKGRPFVAALMGGLAGAFSFWIGASSWEAAVFIAPVSLVLAVFGLMWAVIVPALMVLAERLFAESVPFGDLDMHRGSTSSDRRS